MDAQQILQLTVMLSIVLVVFSFSAKASTDDAQYMFRHWRRGIRAMSAIYIVVPLFTIGLCLVMPLPPVVRLALIAVAVSPIPPILPLKQEKMGSSSSYDIGLLVTASLVALVATPLLLALASAVFLDEARIEIAPIVKPLLLTIGLPVFVGIGLNRLAPGAAQHISVWAFRLGLLLLLVCVGTILAHSWSNMMSLIGNGTLVAILLIIAIGVVAGHLLGGPGNSERGALALAASMRHPGVAIGISAANMPDQLALASATVLLFLLVNLVTTLPYVLWIHGHRTSTSV